MRYCYSKALQRFSMTIRDNELREATVGYDNYNLYFPGVSTCTILAAQLSDDSLIGAHFDKKLSSFDVYVMLQKLLDIRGTRNVVGMWVMGDLLYGETNPQCFMWHRDFRAGAMMNTFAEALDFTGRVRLFDQGALADMHYRVQSVGGGKAAIYSTPVPRINGTSAPFSISGTSWLAQRVT